MSSLSKFLTLFLKGLHLTPCIGLSTFQKHSEFLPCIATLPHMCICTQLSGFATFAIVPFPALRKLRVAVLPFPFLQHEWKLSSVSFSARICLIYSCLITL